MSSSLYLGTTLQDHLEQRIAASRRAWPEYPAKDLEPVGRFVVDKASGHLFLPVTSAVLPGDSLPTGAMKVDAFYISHSTGEPVYLERSHSPSTLDELRAQEADQERQRREHEQATATARAKFLKRQKRTVLTLSEIERKELMTLADAHQTLIDLGCEITTTDGTLRITVPQRLRQDDNEDLAARQGVHEAARLLDYCRDSVVTALQAGKPLPEGPVAVGGGVA